MDGGRLLVSYKPPINKLNGDDLRIWHLMNRGDADVISFKSRTSDMMRGMIDDPLPWRSIDVVETPVAEWAGIVNRRVAEQGISHLVVQLSGQLDQVRWLNDIRVPFSIHASDSRSLGYRRRLDTLSKLRQPVASAAAFIRSRQWLSAERAIAARASRCFVTSPTDRDAFAGGPANVVDIGNGTDWTLAPPLYHVRDHANVLGFHGNLLWPPNMSGIDFVCRRVLPLVRRDIADAEFRVAGGPLVPEARALGARPGVTFLGYVPDLRSVLAEFDLYAAPMFEGSGVKNKLLEAMAAGIPVVCNSLGAEGMDRVGRALFEIEETPEAIAGRIVALLRDPARRAEASAAVRGHAIAHYGWESFSRRFAESLAPVSG